MVTTFSPPAKPKKKKTPILPIVLGVACALLLVLTGITFNKLNAQPAENATLKDALTAISQAAGSDVLSEEALAGEVDWTAVGDALSTAMAQRVNEAQSARAETEQQRTEAARLAGERQAAMEQLTDVRGQTDAVRRDLAERSAQLAELQRKYDADVARLEARIVELTPVDVPGEGAEEAATEVDDAENTEADESAEEVPAPKSGAMVIPEGASQLFKTVRYDGPKGLLTFVTLNDQRLVYKGVPESIYDGLVEAPIFDIYYRFRIMDNFESEPNDRELIRTIPR